MPSHHELIAVTKQGSAQERSIRESPDCLVVIIVGGGIVISLVIGILIRLGVVGLMVMLAFVMRVWVVSTIRH
jgi:hypothetical protein